jgi:AraC family transcriptional regulator
MPDTCSIPVLRRHHSFGRCLRDIIVEGTVIRDTLLSPNSKLPRHRHDAAYACIVLDGSYEERALRSVECRAGSIIFHPAGHAHANKVGSEGARCVNVEFGGSALGQLTLSLHGRNNRAVQLDPAHALLKKLVASLSSSNQGSERATYLATLELIGLASKALAPSDDDTWLARVVDQLTLHADAFPTPSALARMAGVHPFHLNRTFRRIHGETVGSYLRHRRLDAAAARLEQGDEPLADIAVDLGFSDQAHFTRAYRTRFGTTPARARRSTKR